MPPDFEVVAMNRWVMRQQIRVDIGLLTRVLRRLTEAGILEESGVGQMARYRKLPRAVGPDGDANHSLSVRQSDRAHLGGVDGQSAKPG